MNQQRINCLLQTAHDLRGHFGVLATAISLLQTPLQNQDRAKYLTMVSRNVQAAEQYLDQLLVYAQQEVLAANPAADKEARRVNPQTRKWVGNSPSLTQVVK